MNRDEKRRLLLCEIESRKKKKPNQHVIEEMLDYLLDNPKLTIEDLVMDLKSTRK